MDPYQITLNETLLARLFQNDGLKPLLEELLNQVLNAQVTEQIGAEPYERSPFRQNSRNGYRERPITTRIGTLTLQVPRLRHGTFTSDLYERYQRSELALLCTMVEMVVQGVSTRKVNSVVEEMCGAEVSKSTVSALCQKLDPVVNAWRERDLSDKAYPFVLVDALVVRVRENKQVRQKSLLIATGINEEGYREILGLLLGDKESETSWKELFTALKKRGLHGVDMIVSDAHEGLINAIHSHLQGAVWQRCQTHLTRNILDACPKSEQKALHEALRRIFQAEDADTARIELNSLLKNFEKRADKAIELVENSFDDATAILTLPEYYRKRLRTTNSQERLNLEVRRRENVIRIFPNPESAERLLGAILIELDEHFSSGHRYFDMTEYRLYKQMEQQQHSLKESAAKAV